MYIYVCITEAVFRVAFNSLDEMSFDTVNTHRRHQTDCNKATRKNGGGVGYTRTRYRIAYTRRRLTSGGCCDAVFEFFSPEMCSSPQSIKHLVTDVSKI